MVTARRRPHNRAKVRKPGKTVKGGHKGSLTKDLRVADIVALCPGSVEVFAAYGIFCAGCEMGGAETLEEGVKLHGFDAVDLQLLLEDLNALMEEKPARRQELTVTVAAAKALRKIAKGEGKKKEGLLVTTDGRGGFCMEFREGPAKEDRVFTNKKEPTMRVFASPLTLARIGGAVIDYREGRFKLDLANDQR